MLADQLRSKDGAGRQGNPDEHQAATLVVAGSRSEAFFHTGARHLPACSLTRNTGSRKAPAMQRSWWRPRTWLHRWPKVTRAARVLAFKPLELIQ